MWRSVRIAVIAITAALGGCAEWLVEPRPEHSLSPTEAVTAAQTGDGPAAFLAYQTVTTDFERRKWICVAANRDFPQAQAEIARLHWYRPWTGPSIFRSNGYTAYVWAIIALRNGQPVEHMEERLGELITADQRWRATVQAVFWRPDPSQCETMEDSDYFSIVPAEEPRSRFERFREGR
jgi:hypothetical protein